MDNYQKVFCSFADSRLKKSLERIKRQAESMAVYDQIYILDEFGLDNAFRDRFKDKLNTETRGFGYWCWKPQIILQILKGMKDGDILQYVDAGCHLNVNGKKRLLEYFETAVNSPSGIVMFKAKEKEECLPGEQFYDNYEYKYTKGDVFKYFNVANNRLITHSNQIAGTACFIRKDAANMQFIQNWIHAFWEDFSLIDDSVSEDPNFDGFIDHRHDQSIISILAKLRGVETISASEFYTDGDWSQLSNYPIWTVRDKNFGTIQRIKKAIYPFYQFLRGRDAN